MFASQNGEGEVSHFLGYTCEVLAPKVQSVFHTLGFEEPPISSNLGLTEPQPVGKKQGRTFFLLVEPICVASASIG